jgi:4-amino-4-deoxy-L-arabinose transferase-like glycosyltransferase
LRAVKRDHWLLLGILAAAAALRIWWNDVPAYSRADEAVYTNYTRFLLDHSYRELVRDFITDQSRWVYPNPLRWGYFLLTSLTCRAAGRCDERMLAWLSTAAGLACVYLTYHLGKRLVSREAGLVAAALTVTSPLQLALGRRALQDELFCALVLASLIALVENRRLATVAAITLALAVKETMFLSYPALLLAAWTTWRKKDLPLLLVPPLLYFAVFAILARSGGDFFRVMAIVRDAAGAPYAAQYQAGPPHRILIDLLTLSPLVVLLAAARRRWDLPAQISAVFILIFALVTSKNVRYAVMIDPMLRILAASTLLELARVRWAALAAVAVSELWLFHAVFIRARVYDPVTDNLLRALGAIP